MPLFIRLAATSPNMTLMGVFPLALRWTSGSTAALQHLLQIIPFILSKLSFPPLQARVRVALRGANPRHSRCRSYPSTRSVREGLRRALKALARLSALQQA